MLTPVQLVGSSDVWDVPLGLSCIVALSLLALHGMLDADHDAVLHAEEELFFNQELASPDLGALCIEPPPLADPLPGNVASCG